MALITTSAEWDALSAIAGLKSVLVGRLQYGNESKYISICSGQDFSIGSEKFLGVVEEIPKILSKINPQTAIHSISGNPIKIINLEYEPGSRFSDMIETVQAGGASDIGFYNRPAALRIYIPGITTFANCFPLMPNAIVREISHDRRRTTIQIEDDSELVYAELGEYLTNADAADGIALPQETLGKISPIIIGDHRGYYGHTSNLNSTSIQDHIFTEMRDLGIDTSGRRRWKVSAHKLANMVTDETDSDEIWGKFENIGRMCKLAAFNVEFNDNTDGCIISTALNPTFYDSWYGDGSVSTENNTAPGDWQNDIRGNNKDLGNYALSEIAALDAVLTSARIDLDFSGYTSPVADANISEVATYVKHYWTMGTDLAVANVNFRVHDRHLPLLSSTPNTILIEATGNTNSADVSGVHTSIEIRHDRDPGGAVNRETTARVYQVWKRISLTDPERVVSLYAGVRGLQYGDWINARSTADNDPKRTGNFSETHQDDDEEAGADAVIESFPGVVEALLRDFISIDTTKIDENTLNIASNDLPNASSSFYFCATQILERTLFKKFVASLLQSSRSWGWWQTDGTYKMLVMENTYSASDLSIKASDFLSLEFERTPLTDIKTAIDLFYGWNGSEFMASKGVLEDTTAQTKYNITEAQSTLIFQSKYMGGLNGGVTGTKIRAFLKQYLKQPHNILKGVLPRSWLKLGIGHIIDITNPEYQVFGEDIDSNQTRAGQTIYKYWRIFEAKRGGETIEIQAEQLHDLSP